MKKHNILLIIAMVLTLTIVAWIVLENENAAAHGEGKAAAEKVAVLTDVQLSAVGREQLTDGTLWQKYEGDGVTCAVDAATGNLAYVVCDASQTAVAAAVTLDDAQKPAESYAEKLFGTLDGYTITMKEAYDRGGYIEYVYEWRRIENGFDLDEGVTVTVNAGGDLISAAAFSGNSGKSDPAEGLQGLQATVSEENAQAKAEAWLREEIEESELGSIELISIEQKLHGGAPCWAVRMDVHTADGMLEIPYLLYVDMNTGAVQWD